jgi:hypothetical protein
MCLQLPCACITVIDGVEARSIEPEDSPADPELSEVVERLDQTQYRALDGAIMPERWEERRDLE